MNSGYHLEEKGIKEIINLRASLNLRLSPELNKAFPNTIAAPRPNIKNINVTDILPEWVAGFTSDCARNIALIYRRVVFGVTNNHQLLSWVKMEI